MVEKFVDRIGEREIDLIKKQEEFRLNTDKTSYDVKRSTDLKEVYIKKKYGLSKTQSIKWM